MGRFWASLADLGFGVRNCHWREGSNIFVLQKLTILTLLGLATLLPYLRRGTLMCSFGDFGFDGAGGKVDQNGSFLVILGYAQKSVVMYTM